jgi:hypothetical protein
MKITKLCPVLSDFLCMEDFVGSMKIYYQLHIIVNRIINFRNDKCVGKKNYWMMPAYPYSKNLPLQAYAG